MKFEVLAKSTVFGYSGNTHKVQYKVKIERFGNTEVYFFTAYVLGLEELEPRLVMSSKDIDFSAESSNGDRIYPDGTREGDSLMNNGQLEEFLELPTS